VVSLFITLEGPEGCGKTTQLKLLDAWLQEMGYDTLATREPGGTKISEAVRAILLDPDNSEMTAEAEILLYSASRAQIVGEVIRPNLDRGTIVICDRYADSTLAYQGYGRQLDLETLKTITAFATGGLVPNLTIYLDIPIEVGLRRKTDDEWNRLENQELAFHERVRQGYLQMVEEDPDRWVVIDAARSLLDIQMEIRTCVAKLLPRPDAE